MDTFGNCVYNLPEHGDDSSNDWRKCAVASCGKLLYGTNDQPEVGESRSFAVYVLGGVLAVTLIVSLFLVLAIYKIKKKSQSSVSIEKEEDVHYAALKQRTSNRPRTAAGGTNTDVSLAFLPDLSGVSSAFLPDLSGVSSAFLPDLSGVSFAFLNDLSGVSSAFLPDLSGVSSAFLPDL
uniref:Uncharacterized protein n=1 Tax=Knipowitschia caucasica TaxID=637954 RepID=A0AAV2KLG4_KNICA